MLQSAFPSIYSLYFRYSARSLDSAVANLDPEARESLSLEIAAGVDSFSVVLEGEASSDSSLSLASPSSPKENVTRLLQRRKSGVVRSSTVDGDGSTLLDNSEDEKGPLNADRIVKHDVLYPVTTGPATSGLGEPADADRDDMSNNHNQALVECDIETALADLDAALVECRASLEIFYRKENFLEVHLRRYRQLMLEGEERIMQLEENISSPRDNRGGVGAWGDKQRGASEIASLYDAECGTSAMVETNGVTGIGTGEDNVTLLQQRLQTLQTKHERNQSSLRDVENIRRDILAQMEALRRNIERFEDKRGDYLKKREECQEFLLAAGELM